MDDRAALEAFVVNNDDLREIEARLDPFNLFEAIGVTRHELRHSQFLAYLLNPNENHGLADHFTRTFLQSAFRDSAPPGLSPLELDLVDLDDVEIRREWRNIDILILDRRNRRAIIIENKIGSSEHSGQLSRYWTTVADSFPEYRIAGIYLTPDRLHAQDDRYVPVSYQTVAEVLDAVVQRSHSLMGQEVATTVRHYVQMLRRHVVTDSELADLCRRIYARHRKAIDLIIEHRPDLQSEIRDVLEQLIDSAPDIEKDHCTKQYVRFAYRPWITPLLMQGDGWTPSKNMLLFEFQNFPNRLTLNLVLGPGPAETRGRLFEALKSQPPISPPTKTLNSKWNVLWMEELLSREAFDADLSAEDAKATLTKKWDTFLTKRLPLLASAVKSVDWIWDAFPTEPRPDQSTMAE